MRRRNTALATVGGVVAAAVFIGTPVALLSGNNDRDDIDPAPQPTPTVTEDAQPDWLTEIPAEFPLTQGMTDGGELAEGGTDAFDLCGTSYPTPRGTAVTETWSYSDDGESYVRRTFQLWPDDVSAAESLTNLVEAVQACPQQPTAGGEDIIESRLIPFDVGGDDSVTFVQQIVSDDGLVSQLSTVEVTRVGNAVLVNSSYGSAGGAEAIEVATQILRDQSATTRAAMCVFSADPCSGGEPTSTPEGVASSPGGVQTVGPSDVLIPDDFPLAQRMDESEQTDVEGPGPDVESSPVVDVCGTDVWAPSGVVQRLAARETGIEYLATRELTTFVSADEPADSLTQVRDAVRDCPRIEGEPFGSSTRILEGPEGYDSFTFGVFADEGLGGQVFQLTRVGSAVLVVYETGEMSEASLQPVADGLSETTLALAPEMCLWTEDGC
jgi:hypothetical protein